jgi:hypothetical protein
MKAEPKRRSGYTLPPTDIHVMPGRNLRRRDENGLYQGHQELVDFIIENGVKSLPPIRVCLHDGKYFVTAGHRRIEAIRDAISQGCEIVNVPVDMDDKLSSESDHLITQITENSGVAYSDLEVGDCVKKYLGYGHSIEDIARRTGKKVPYIKKCYDLTFAPMEIKAMIDSGEMATTTAVNLIREKGTGADVIAIAAKAKATGKKITGDVVKSLSTDINSEELVEYLGGVPWEMLSNVDLHKVVKIVKASEKRRK